jgi:hypothetical protein
MTGRKTKWLTVAPLVAMLTAWAERIIKGRAEPSTEPPAEMGEGGDPHPSG